MSSRSLDYFKCLVVILVSVIVKLSSCNENSARSLDLSWRPLSHSPYQQQFFQGSPPGLISYAHLDTANKDEIVQVAKHNAQLLKKFKDIAHQPITSYIDPYQLYSQTPGPGTKFVSTTAYLNSNLARQPQHQSLEAAASSHIMARVPYPSKSVPLYQTKLNYLGKQDMNAMYHQNSIHQPITTTPKIAGYTKEHGRLNYHYHHPSFGMIPLSTTTKRIPVFSSSVTPHPHIASKNHPVMTKYQAHMALAASQGHHHKLKHQQNYGFSPPSQLMSNYANFGPVTSNPFNWHSAGGGNSQYHLVQDYHHHVHKPDSHHQHPYHNQHQQQQPIQPQQQQQKNPNNNIQQNSNSNSNNQHSNQQHNHLHHHLNQQEPNFPSVHPSIITPFLEQVQLKQKEAAAAEQKNAFKQSHEANSHENNGSFEVINDVFSKHLVPPPPNPSKSTANSYSKSKPEKPEKVNKYNLSMQSPLQDASRFNYNNVINVTPSPHVESLRFKPSASDNTYLSTEKPNVFVQLNNRTKDNVYKQHKLLHPSYTGAGGYGKRRPIFSSVEAPSFSAEKPFLPTPYKPEKEEEIKINYKPQHSFFTVEDAVTPNLSYQVIKSHIPVDEDQEPITYGTPSKHESDFESVKYTLTTPSSTEQPLTQSTAKPRQKLRRRKPKPQQGAKRVNEEQSHEITTTRPNHLRGNIKNSNSQDDKTELKTRNRVNHPSRVRNKVNFSSQAATAATLDYDATIRPSTEEEKRNEITTSHQVVTTEAATKSEESSEQPEGVKRRVRFRYKNKLRTSLNPLEPADFKPKSPDNQISDSEHGDVFVRQSDETTDLNAVTESGINEIKSSLKLPNLKLRNEALTTLPTTADTISTSVQPSITTAIDQEESNNLSKIANRPRFSIKEYKRKQLSTAATAATSLTSVSTAATTTKPDSQRFNRLRVNIRRRNETAESGEEVEEIRRRYSSSRGASTTTTTETPVPTPPKRGSLPKRTYATRNFTKPAFVASESETTASPKPAIKNATTFGQNRPTSPNLRSRIQSYKKKEPLSDVVETSPDAIKNINLSSETAITQEQSTTTSTEAPTSLKHETSIMKIAKTPSSVNVVKSTTSNFLDDESDISRVDFDLTGSPSEHSKRVAELTISGNDNYSFKSANIGPLSRRIPNYFTISTDDPILPIQAFFPQIKTNEEN